VVVQNNNVYVNGVKIDRNPLEQAKSLAHWLETLIEQSTGKRFYVRPVVVFPGWYVENKQKGLNVWVLNPKGLLVYVRRNPKHISPEDKQLIYYHLSRYVRSLASQS